MNAPLLLYNCLLVLPESDARAPLKPGAVLIEGGRIAAVVAGGGAAVLESRAGEKIDLGGQVLMPGLVNAHCHSYANATRGTENSLPLEQWALYTSAYGRSLSEESIRVSILLGAAEMLRAGVTAVLDHFPHVARSDAALQAHDDSGMRVGFAPFMHDLHDHAILDVELPEELRRRVEGARRPTGEEYGALFRRLKKDWHGKDGRITIFLGPNAPQRCSPELWRAWRDLAAELDLGAHTHLLETQPQSRAGKSKFPGGIVAEMKRRDVLNDRLSVAHGIWLTADERALLAEHGAAVVHNPASNLMLGSGHMPLEDYRRRGVTIALGSDSANTGGRQDMFEIMRLAMMLHRPAIGDPARWPDAREALGWATQGGARVLCMARELGRIERGCRADLAVVDMRGAGMAALIPNLTALVQQGGPEAVTGTMVAGRWLYRDGKVLAFDERAALARFAELREEIVARAKDEVATANEAVGYFAGLAARA